MVPFRAILFRNAMFGGSNSSGCGIAIAIGAKRGGSSTAAIQFRFFEVRQEVQKFRKAALFRKHPYLFGIIP